MVSVLIEANKRKTLSAAYTFPKVLVANFKPCATCRNSLDSEKVPTLSRSNGFVYRSKQHGLPALDPISIRLVSPRLPFMRMRRLHCDGSYDGELVKEAMLEATDSLFEEFKNKKEIVSAINTLQLSARTVTRRIEVIAENLEAELANDMENCIFFSLQMDESTDVTNISQLAICVKMVFSDFTTKEEFLKVLPLKGSTRGEDIFSTFKKYITDVKLPVQKLSSITTDGAAAMTEIIDKPIEEFSSRFEDFAALEPVLRFFINPFNVTEDDVLEIVSGYFGLHNIEDLELEIINLQSDIILKAHRYDKMFWNLVDEN
ncbi:uncharacterized protein TNCT_369451, partial [Trichonephila clavata]